MKDKDKQPIIVPYGYNMDGNLMGNPAAHLLGLPIYVDEPEEGEREEDLL